MRLLLDTQIYVWSTLESVRLPRKARELLQDSAVKQVLSTISVWEIAIKHARHGGRGMPLSGKLALRTAVERGIEVLSVMGPHAAAVDDLPPLHRDPFDRMLVAQALTEPMRLLTADPTLARYSDTVILV